MPRKQAQLVVLEMLEAFERGLTEPVLERLLSFAKRRVAMLAKAGIRRTADDAKSMVQDAITDTLTPVVTWERERVGLETHLRMVIKTRSLNRMKQAKRTPHKVDGGLAGWRTHRRGGLGGGDRQAAPFARGRRGGDGVMTSVRERAGGDHGVVSLLDAYSEASNPLRSERNHMDTFIETIRTAATPDQKQAGAVACRAILAALEGQVGHALSALAPAPPRLEVDQVRLVGKRLDLSARRDKRWNTWFYRTHDQRQLLLRPANLIVADHVTSTRTVELRWGRSR